MSPGTAAPCDRPVSCQNRRPDSAPNPASPTYVPARVVSLASACVAIVRRSADVAPIMPSAPPNQFRHDPHESPSASRPHTVSGGVTVTPHHVHGPP